MSSDAKLQQLDAAGFPDAETPNNEQPSDKKRTLALFLKLDEFEEQEARWLIPGMVPEGQISTFASDGGIGKTSVACNVMASLSAGKPCFLDPPDYHREQKRVLFFTTEDSIRVKIKRKLRLAGANMSNIIAPDFAKDPDGLLRKLKFGTNELAAVIRELKPDLCIFDPVQGFVPPQLNMGNRNAMRDCLAPLIALGEECGTTFIILCHTNKRKGAYARDRMADSADIWDISRSVLMAGFAEEEGVRYLSNEKNNYAGLHETVLFTIDGDGLVENCGTTHKRDREYQTEAAFGASKPVRNDCKENLLQILNGAGGDMRTKALDEELRALGYSFSTARRAKEELKKAKEIEHYNVGQASEKIWHTRIVDNGFQVMPDDFPNPFKN